MNSLAEKFLLDPDVTFLNHGSFGATPKPVFECYQQLQLELERQPMKFLGREYSGRMAEARKALAETVGTEPDNIVYVTNATTAVNIVARSLSLDPGDRVLSTDHEYGALDRTWQYLSERRGFTYSRHPIPLPAKSDMEIVETLWSGVTSNTRVIFLSHITSPTAITFPVDEICRLARQQGIITIIDGAHAPGQIPLSLDELGADYYAANLHKWLCAPKGAAFLYARPERQAILEPLIVSWGWRSEKPGPSAFVDLYEWVGTKDPSAFLSVPEAIRFQQENNWEEVRKKCHELAVKTQNRLVDLTGLHPLTSPSQYVQMVSALLPPINPEHLQKSLHEKYQIEVIVDSWNAQPYIRVSIQGYNGEEDIDRLLEALRELQIGN
ncbi:MAG: aminotransferase class V-fold PLP-dependent enzyme [Anaerolineales bacterium]|nr:aminotransferase class V-fold PLP-dependent enzyme [Anaerolineales bacterium]